MKSESENTSLFLFAGKIFGIVLILGFLTGCGKKKDLPSPVSDFSEIVEKGEIMALTLSSSMSYFIYKGEPMGYEYELLQNFASEQGLKINLKVAENENKLREMLLSGEGDLVAYNIPITISGKENLLYCGREIVDEQILVQRANKRNPILKDVTELIGKEIWVIHDSKYYHRLVNLNDELGGGIDIRIIEKDTVTTEDLIEMVSKDQIPYTIADETLAKLNKTFYPNINIQMKVSHSQRSSWAVKKDMPDLANAINDWFSENTNTPRYRAIIKRYFEMSKFPGDEPAPLIGPGQISPYDSIFKKYAKELDWDWRLLASIAYQESKFHLDRTSWAGARGLMGLMPKTAQAFGVAPEEIDNPEANLRGAVGLLKRLNSSFKEIEDKNERIKFILASYNGGSGHVYDARALAEKYEKNPLLWEGNVEEYLRLKNLPEYYNDPVCKNGYFRGRETLNYVHSVMERWRFYLEKVENEK